MSGLKIELDPASRPATVAFRLSGVATFRDAPDLREALFAAIAASRGKNLVVELDAVRKMDTAAMAVLVEGCIAARDGDPAVFLVCAGESVRKVFKLAGLEEALTRCYSCWEDVERAIAV